jgi:hypothetical protein
VEVKTSVYISYPHVLRLMPLAGYLNFLDQGKKNSPSSTAQIVALTEAKSKGYPTTSKHPVLRKSLLRSNQRRTILPSSQLTVQWRNVSYPSVESLAPLRVVVVLRLHLITTDRHVAEGIGHISGPAGAASLCLSDDFSAALGNGATVSG